MEPIHARPGRNIHFEQISLEQGLTQNTVNSILQDNQGFMWFATQDGLNKYDGYKFTIYRHDPNDSTSLSNNYIWSILEDEEDNLWIGTRGGGLDKFDKKTGVFTRHIHQADNPKSLSNNSVRSIYQDSGGNLWIGTTGGGLNKFDKNSGEFTRYSSETNNPKTLSHNSVNSISEDSGGNLWIGTDNGLNKLDPKAGTFTRYFNQIENPRSLSNNIIKAVFEDSKGNLWIGTIGGLNKFEKKTEDFTLYLNQTDNPKSLSNNYVWSIFEDSGGDLWIGTVGGGLNKLDRKKETFTRYVSQAGNPKALCDNTIYSIIEDDGGNLWIGTLSGGISKFNRKAGSFPIYLNKADNPQSFSQNSIHSILEDSKGNMWIGSYGSGLVEFDRNSGDISLYKNQAENPQSLSQNYVRSILEGSDGYLWIGTFGGLNRFDLREKTFTRYLNQPGNPKSLSDNHIITILEDSRGNLWIGTYSGGLNNFDRETETFTRYLNQADNPKSLSHNSIYSIIEDSKGDLWVGTTGGLNKFNRKEKSFTRYLHQDDNPKSLSHNCLNSVVEDSEGNLWIGTDGGLNRFDRKSETFIYYRVENGLPNDVIYGILEDKKGYLWLSTNKGLSKFNPKTETFTNYDKNDGLQSDEFNAGAYYKDRSGKMYFGGIDGFNAFYPDGIQDNKYIPPVVITDFLLFNKSVNLAKTATKSDSFQLEKHINLTKEIILNYTDYIFAFEFSVLNYRQSEKNQFAYKLEGFDEDWVETDYALRRATYTDLPHGEYIFRVKGSNDDGYWNEKGTNIRITILPPPWRTWWAYSLYALLALSIVSWFVRAMLLRARRLVADRVQQFKEKQKKAEEFAKILEIKVEDRTRELKDVNEELKDVNKELKDVNEEFKEVNTQLVSANERLRDLDKMKSRFFANISHELRTPLTLILAPVESMLSGDLGEIAEEHLEQITGVKRSALELLKHIDDLLDLSRLEEARLRLRLEPFDLSSLLVRILDFARPLAERKKIEFDLSCEENLTINADEAKLERVFVNLLSNALKFTDPNGKISARVLEDDDSINVAVEDTGIGIPKEDLERIFDRFGQVDPSMTRRSGGSGIGLSLAKELVELHRGRLLVTSKLDQGSTFTVEIPKRLDEIIPPSLIERRVNPLDVTHKRREQDQNLTEWTNELLSSPEYRFMGIGKVPKSRITAIPQSPELKSARLLVADDNPEVLSYLQQSLKDRYDIWTAQDGKEAWELLVNHRHDLVIADVMMPEMSGLELTHRIKKDPRTQDTPVILLTARSGAEHRMEGHAVGADQYVTKPFNPSELRAAIKSLLSGRKRSIEVGARRRSASMETLLGGMAHELHNACHQMQNAQTAIFALALKLAKVDSEPQPKSNADVEERLGQMGGICQRALERVSKVVQSLEHYTRNQMQMPWKIINLDKLIVKEVNLLTTAEEKEVQVKLSLDSGVPVRGPEEEIRQMVLNLVENAIHAVEIGGLVEVKTTSQSGKIHLSVCDNGCGVPADKKDRIFDPFFTTKDPGKGMGLGLSLCKRTITDLGGEIELRSEEGVGTQMLVDLPAASFFSTKPPPP
ncbi:MAG: response regulator [Proteobacteria bacterium]|nr:response regulator [Pseudomonadota bacterium]